MPESVSSDHHPLLKEVRRAAARGALTADGFAVAEGFHLLEEALASACPIRAILVSEAVRDAVSAHVRGLKRVRVVAVPHGSENVHEIRVCGAFGKLTMKVENVPSQSNPKTSQLAAFSAVATLKNLTRPLRVGT